MFRLGDPHAPVARRATAYVTPRRWGVNRAAPGFSSAIRSVPRRSTFAVPVEAPVRHLGHANHHGFPFVHPVRRSCRASDSTVACVGHCGAEWPSAACTSRERDPSRCRSPLERVAEVAGAARGASSGKAIVGQQRVVREILIAFLAGGHCLLRGVPGLAKTLLIKTLARGGATCGSTASSSRPT